MGSVGNGSLFFIKTLRTEFEFERGGVSSSHPPTKSDSLTSEGDLLARPPHLALSSIPQLWLGSCLGLWPSSPLPSWLHQPGSARINKEAHQRSYFYSNDHPSPTETPPKSGLSALPTPSRLSPALKP